MGGGKSFSAHVSEGDDPGPIIVEALDTTEAFARQAGIANGMNARLMVVVEELLSNALRHGRDGRAIDVAFDLAVRDGAVELRIEDTGGEFDPTTQRDFQGPDGETGGGVGLELVRQWASELEYERVGDTNRLRLVLR